MANEKLFPDIEATDLNALHSYLSEAGFAPLNASQSRDADAVFQELHRALARDLPSPPDFRTETEVEATEVSARAARDDVLPVVVVKKTGSFASDLVMQKETLELVAFGTISTETYHDMVWEHLQKFPGWNRAEVGIYEAQRWPSLRFLIRCKRFVLELKYFQCSSLVRKYPDIVTAPLSFLVDCSEDVRKAVEELRESIGIVPSAARKYSYCYLKALSTSCGTNSSDPEHILRSSTVTESSLDLTLRDSFRNWNSDYCLHLKSTPASWLDVLQTVNRRPIHTKMTGEAYVIVSIMHTGISSLQAGQWLMYVESKLGMLKQSLQVAAGDGPVTQWPYRLVEGGADPEAKDYEGYFLLALDVSQKERTLTINEIVESWRSKIERNELTIPNHCFISIVRGAVQELEHRAFKRCTRVLARPYLAIDAAVADYEEEPEFKQNSKRDPRPKPHPSPSSDSPAPKLRTASDIHNRLRHDNTYNIDEYVIGYEDRVAAKIKEKPAAQWVRETTDGEFIPEQRIRYFKRYFEDGQEELVWDRTARLDRIFGSGRRSA